VLKPKRDNVYPRFLMYSLRNMIYELTSGARGVAQKGIYLKSLKKLSIPLPPLAEQKRIVARLDAAVAEIDKAIELTQMREASLVSLKSSLLFSHLQENDAQ